MASEHIYKQFDSDLGDVRTKVLEMGTIVEEQLANSMQSLIEADEKLAKKVINKDEDVNSLELNIDEECSLLIFQLLLIPAWAILTAFLPYLAFVKSIAFINICDLFSIIGANKLNSFSLASLNFDKTIPAF